MGDTHASTAANAAHDETSHATLAEREESLRRVAVVLSSLPASTASHLLEKVDGYSRHIVQQAIATLHTVAPDERQTILHSFKSGMSRSTPAQNTEAVRLSEVADGIQDEFVPGRSSESNVIPAHSVSHSMPTHAVSTHAVPTHHTSRYGEQLSAFFPASNSSEDPSQSPFHFLQNVSIDEMVTLLSGEHPQTIALVLSSIPPKTAADILPQLNATLQQQTLGRIGRLNEVPDATLIEVAGHLQSRYCETVGSVNESSGKRALEAIMAELPACPPATTTMPADAVTSTAPATPTAIPPPAAASEEIPELKIVTGTQEIESSSDSVEAQPVSSDDDSSQQLVDATHQHLIALPPQELVSALGRVATRDALLTLCGLPNATAEAAIACLSRSKARSVRRGIETLGPLQLREIDESKRAVALVSVGAGDTNESFYYSRAA